MAALALSGCVLPDWGRFEGAADVARVAVGQTTRDELRARLGAPAMADTAALQVYDWEKAKVLLIAGYGPGVGGAAFLGHKGTRALFTFDDTGRVERTEVSGSGQADRAAPAAALPLADASPLAGACAGRSAMRARFAGPAGLLVVQHVDDVRICDAAGLAVAPALRGRHPAWALSADGQRAATVDLRRDAETTAALTLRTLPDWAILRDLAPPVAPGWVALVRWGVDVSLSADGRRVAAAIGDRGVSVYEADTGRLLLALDGHLDPQLSPDGRWLASKSDDGLHLTEIDASREAAVRPPARYPYGMSQDPFLARQLMVRLGKVAFSADGRRIAIATCAHAEVWDLEAAASSPAWSRGLVDAFLLPFSGTHGVCAASVAFSAGGRTLAVANEGAVVTYDLQRREVLSRHALPAPVVEVAFDADLARAAFVADGLVRLWTVGHARSATTAP